MLHDNVDMVRRWVEQFGNTAPADIPSSVTANWDPTGDFYPARKFPDARPRHGRDEIAEFFVNYIDSWGRVDFVVNRIADVGDDRVFLHATINAEGHGTRMSLAGDIYGCVWLRNGRIFRWEDHLTEAGALEALGVPQLAALPAAPDG